MWRHIQWPLKQKPELGRLADPLQIVLDEKSCAVTRMNEWRAAAARLTEAIGSVWGLTLQCVKTEEHTHTVRPGKRQTAPVNTCVGLHVLSNPQIIWAVCSNKLWSLYQSDPLILIVADMETKCFSTTKFKLQSWSEKNDKVYRESALRWVTSLNCIWFKVCSAVGAFWSIFNGIT